MKKIILSALLSAIFFAGNAQSTLAFSRALLVSSQQTVPDNAVWKIVSLMPSALPIVNNVSNTTSVPAAGTFAILVNSNPIYSSSINTLSIANYNGYQSSAASSATNSNGLALPIWLPAGTTLAASTNIQYISVIEFLVN